MPKKQGKKPAPLLSYPNLHSSSLDFNNDETPNKVNRESPDIHHYGIFNADDDAVPPTDRTQQCIDDLL